MIRLSRFSTAFWGAAALASCDGIGAPDPKVQELAGIDGLTFGMSLTEALSTVPASFFSGLALKQCQETGALYGCLVLPKSDLSTYKTKGGVPYTIQLAFNKFDKLTDIELKYDRRPDYEGAGPKLSRDECRSIFERTLTWVREEQGPLSQKKDVESGEVRHDLPGGHSYRSYETGGSIVASLAAAKAGGRSVDVMLTYIKVDRDPYCSVSVSYEDSRAVERWKIDPSERPVMENAAQPSE